MLEVLGGLRACLCFWGGVGLVVGVSEGDGRRRGVGRRGRSARADRTVLGAGAVPCGAAAGVERREVVARPGWPGKRGRGRAHKEAAKSLGDAWAIRARHDAARRAGPLQAACAYSGRRRGGRVCGNGGVGVGGKQRDPRGCLLGRISLRAPKHAPSSSSSMKDRQDSRRCTQLTPYTHAAQGTPTPPS